MFVRDARPGHIEIACIATRYPLVPVMTRAVDAGCRAGRAGMLPAAKQRVKPMPYPPPAGTQTCQNVRKVFAKVTSSLRTTPQISNQPKTMKTKEKITHLAPSQSPTPRPVPDANRVRMHVTPKPTCPKCNHMRFRTVEKFMGVRIRVVCRQCGVMVACVPSKMPEITHTSLATPN